MCWTSHEDLGNVSELLNCYWFIELLLVSNHKKKLNRLYLFYRLRLFKLGMRQHRQKTLKKYKIFHQSLLLTTNTLRAFTKSWKFPLFRRLKGVTRESSYSAVLWKSYQIKNCTETYSTRGSNLAEDSIGYNWYAKLFGEIGAILRAEIGRFTKFTLISHK